MESIMMARPDAWYLLALWYLVFALVWLGVLGVSMLACLLMVNIIAAPVYEMVSVAVEKDPVDNPFAYASGISLGS